MAESISDTLQLSTVINKFNTTDNCISKCSPEEADDLFEQLPHLVNRQFKSWYCKQFYRLGRARVMELASLACADAKYPPKLFSLLLKNAK